MQQSTYKVNNGIRPQIEPELTGKYIRPTSVGIEEESNSITCHALRSTVISEAELHQSIKTTDDFYKF